MLNSYQAAIYEALKTGPAGTLVSGRIRNKAGDSDYPYIWITDSIDDWSTKSTDGISANVEVHIGSRYDGDKEVNQISEAVRTSLTHGLLVGDGAQIVLVQFITGLTTYDPDGLTRHRILKFNLLVTEQEV